MRCFFFILIFGLLGCHQNAADGRLKTAEQASKISLSSPAKMKALRQKAFESKQFCRQHNMNTDVAILIDMTISSGLKRLVVWDYKRDTIIMAGLVTHGCGTQKRGHGQSADKPAFSNVMDSHCSSLGKYKIGARGYSTWGIHVNYLLYGLEKTNSNALARTVVLHSWDAIPKAETYPAGIAQSWGCPAVSNDFMQALDKMLMATSKPVLLWIYI